MKNIAAFDTAGPAEQTRLALVNAALVLFGQKGFEATTTREIAARAKANIGSIAYHFGGKEGLREACATHVVTTILRIAGSAIDEASIDASTPEAAEARLIAVVERMVGFVVAMPEAGPIVRFVLRELSQPTTALNIIYSGVFEPVHKRLCLLWEAATGEPAESERTKITVFTLIGQVVYFRIGREAVLRRMGWKSIGPENAAAVAAVASDNMRAILAQRKGRKS